MSELTSTNQSDTPEPDFQRWRWLRVWLLLVTSAALLALYVAITLNTNVVPAMLLFSALSGSIAFSTFVADRTGINGVIPLFNLILTILFGGAISLVVGGTLDSWLVGDPLTPGRIWWVGPAEETAKLILPVLLFVFGSKKYQSAKAGLILGLAGASGFAVMETMGYGLSGILTAGSLLVAEGPLQSADRMDMIKHLMGGFTTPVFRGICVPFGHLAWTGMITTVWWSEWEKSGGIRITGPVIGIYLFSMFLHSANDFFPLFMAMISDSGKETMGGIPTSVLSVLSIIGFVVIAIISLKFFWHVVKKRIINSH